MAWDMAKQALVGLGQWRGGSESLFPTGEHVARTSEGKRIQIALRNSDIVKEYFSSEIGVPHSGAQSKLLGRPGVPPLVLALPLC